MAQQSHRRGDIAFYCAGILRGQDVAPRIHAQI